MILITDNNVQYFIYGSMVNQASRSNTLTQHPTVEGTSFADHFYREPDSVGFTITASEISKSPIYSLTFDENKNRVENILSEVEIRALVERWFTKAVRVSITTLRFNFENQILKSYSWSDRDLSIFNPTLSFSEARVQTLRIGTIINPDQYYQAAYGNTVSVGGSTAIESKANIGDALKAGAAGAAVGALIGSVVPGIGTATGAIIGGGIGFLGSLFVD